VNLGLLLNFGARKVEVERKVKEFRERPVHPVILSKRALLSTHTSSYLCKGGLRRKDPSRNHLEGGSEPPIVASRHRLLHCAARCDGRSFEQAHQPADESITPLSLSGINTGPILAV